MKKILLPIVSLFVSFTSFNVLGNSNSGSVREGEDIASLIQEWDVVVYGGSSAAISTAVQVHRMGLNCIIVCPENRIGGLTTGGLGQTDIGNKSAFGGVALEFYRDIASWYKDKKHWTRQKREDYLPDGQCSGTKGEDSMWTFEPSAALAVLEGWIKRDKIHVVRGEKLDRSKGGVTIKNGRIVSFKTLSGRIFKGKMFVDATYEGDLMAASGVSYTVGREDNSKYGETLSGCQRKHAIYHQFEKGVSAYVKEGDPSSGLLPGVEMDDGRADGTGDNFVQAYCFRMCLTDDPENRIPFKKPSSYDDKAYELLFRQLVAKGEKYYEAGREWRLPWINSRMPNRKTDTNNRDGFSSDFVGMNWAWPEASYEEREKIFNAHLNYQRGLMWTLANHPRVPQSVRRIYSRWGTCKDEFTDGPGDGWQSQLYVREARRMVGSYVMTEANCRGKVTVPKPVAMAAYTMDSHHVRRLADKNGNVFNEGDVEVGTDENGVHFPPYPIDYGSIIPKKEECENLFVPVCLSASHIAFGSIRMEPVFFALGQVAGTAAAQAIAAGCAVQDLPYEPLSEKLLKDGQVLAIKKVRHLNVARLVNPMIGTGNGGNTFPGPVWPMGMVQPGPDTSLVITPHDHNPSDFSQALDYRSMCNGYDPRSDVLFGFTQTHLSGTGCTDLQDFLLLPFTGAYPTNEAQRFVAKMDKKSEKASAGYYAVTLPEHSVRAELTSSKRVAYHRYTFKKGGRVHVFFDCQAGSFAWWSMSDPNHPRHRVVWSRSKVIEDEGAIEAYNRVTCWNKGREIFTRIEFSKKPVSWCEVPHHFKAGRRYVLDFDVAPGESIVAKAAISSVDFEGARKNLAADPAGFDFDARRRDCERAWDEILSCAYAEGDDKAKRLFYTALYHAYVQPNLFSDVDGRCRFQDIGGYGKTINKIRAAKGTEVYTTLSTWDTYRAAHPLYTILTPKMAGAVAETMLEWYDEMGKMPKWQMFGGENYCMMGPHSITIVADALIKGLLKSSPKRVLEAVEKTIKAHNGMGNGKSRWDIYYDKIGYLPCDKRWASVSETLEWGMVDYAAMRVSELAGNGERAAYHRKHLKNYKNFYDAETGLMRGRKADGSWRTPFEPYRQWPAKGDWNDYTEGGAMQYSWHVMWDPEGLVELHGGREKFASHLEKLFTDNTEVPADQKTGECSGTIGQFALGNEHDQHVPYLWQYAGRPDRAAEIVRELCERYFFDSTDGLCGNDDCGQISSWYVFACLGFYSLNPVGGDYVIGAPQMPKITLHLENGKTFTIIAKNLSRENKYVKSVTLNGKKMDGFIIKHADIFKGGELVFEMASSK